MDAETRAIMAISLTRGILTKALDSPFTLVTMTWEEVEPDAVEDTIAEILWYLEKTAPEKPQEAT